ncbi:uncharacterized protein [Clytia hemisphaerica]
MKEKAGAFVQERGSRVNVQVNEHSTRDAVLDAALTKISLTNQYFCPTDSYSLCYSDGRVVNTIPGTDKPFRLDRYQEWFGKPYSKVCLFVCLQMELLQHDEMSSSSSSFSQSDEEISSLRGSKKSKKNKRSKTVQKNQDPPPPQQRKLPCPICNSEFSISELNEHVNKCLEEEKTPLMIAQETFYDEYDDNTQFIDLVNDEHQESEVEKAQSVKEVISTFRPDQNPDVSIVLNVRRGYEFTDFQKFFSKTWNKSKIGQVLKIKYIGEPGKDTGGISREFYSAFNQILKRFFKPVTDGIPLNGFEPAVGYMSVSDGTMICIGHLFISSIVCSGPAPNFLSPWAYEYLVGGIENTVLHPESCSQKFQQIHQAKNVEELRKMLCCDEGIDLLDSIGFQRNPATVTMDDQQLVLRSLFMKEKHLMLHLLSQISKGMEAFGALTVIRENFELFRPVFTPSMETYTWTRELLLEKLEAQYENEIGSNKRNNAINTYKSFLDFVDECFQNESTLIPAPILMKFLTGCETIPPVGLPADKMKIYFKHDCGLSPNGTACACLPTVSTCALYVKIPVHIQTEEQMMESFVSAMKKGSGFQLS